MSDIASIANQIRRIAQAIADGRIEAAQIAEMTDEQLDDYNTRLSAELDEVIAESETLLKEGDS